MRALCFGLIVLLSVGFARAQDDLPPVIAPDDIFTEAVEVVGTLPILNADDVARTLYYFDPTANEWRMYPYPENIEGLDAEYYSQYRSDGTHAFSPNAFWRFNADAGSEIWLLDPMTGEFSHPDTACGRMRALPDEGEWVVYEDEGQSRLCFTETGEITAPIPVVGDASSCSFQIEKPTEVSPNGRWVLFFCGELSFTAYTYDTVNQTFLYLGASSNEVNQYVEIAGWLNDTEVVIHAYPSWNPPSNTYYIVDVSQADGLTFVMWGFYNAPAYYHNPPHLEWFECEYVNGCSIDANEDSLRYYDFTTRELTIYPHLPRIQGISSVIPDGSGDRLYRALDVEEYVDGFHMYAPSATLIRFNYDTDTYAELFSGEIEWISGFSPDGRYVALAMGDDGEIASNEISTVPQAGYMPQGNSSIAIFDFVTNQIVYEAQGARWGACPDYGFSPFLECFSPMWVSWLDVSSFLITGVVNDQPNAGDYIVTLTDGAFIETRLPAIERGISSDRQHLLLGNVVGEYSVYDVLFQQNTIITQPLPVGYEMTILWLIEDTLSVRLYDSEYVDQAYWYIRVP